MEYRGEEISENELAQYEELDRVFKKLFILYDYRARYGTVGKASVYVTVASEQEASRYGKDPAWEDGIWYEYDVEPSEDPKSSGVLVNGRPRWDLPPNHIRRG